MWTFIVGMVKTFLPYVLGALLIGSIWGFFQLKGCYWENRAHRAELAETKAEVKSDLKDVEVKYAPTIQRMDKLAKRSIKRHQAESKAIPSVPGAAPTPPLPDPSEVADANDVADTINGLWGGKSKTHP